MKRHKALMACLLALGSTHAAPIESAEPPAVLGAWRFVSEVDRHADGSLASVGPEKGYEGLLVYTAGGLVSVQIMPRGRTFDLETASLQQLKETVEAGTAYFGTYTIDAKAGSIVHAIESSLDPSVEGKKLTRSFRLSGDTLVLSGTWQYGAETLSFEISWKRLE